MNVPRIEMSWLEAHSRLEQYKSIPPEKRTDEDEAAIAGYRALADRKPVIDLQLALAQAGLNDIGWPRLAIAAADALSVRFEIEGGNALFCAAASCRRTWHHSRGARRLHIRLPAATFPAWSSTRHWSSRQAFLPTIPPPHRPARGIQNYHVLWEAEWAPRAPVDPLLLRHLGGTLYIVLAEWDLTPLEQAILNGRISRS